MEQKNWMELLAGQALSKQVYDTNQYTEKYGLALTKADTELLVAERTQTLKEERRVEFGQSILPKIIYVFCDSEYISQSDYTDTLVRLQEIFYS
ncbi:DUF6323 family protein [Hespellia stercorisuis]|uniref:Uncharacterized protein n=1 Tax=Hespellia stercorisuis DSM 15480 TaxID=1121950 RepID=A0A1M6MXT8_9FIRM|nr:DUF6323 family protein [Hespellia stercorisuis]SHJ88297.1 hypothetical protein SAMN02745243_01648 [Hespellia stercorisuis DSM 15480]